MTRAGARFLPTLLLAAAACLHGSLAAAYTVVSLTPQGMVPEVRQVVVRFDADVISFGDPRATDPFAVRCDDPQLAEGHGHWLSAREWVHDFAQPLTAGLRCTVTANPDFRSRDGSHLQGPQRYRFNTGGPRVRDVWPGSWEPVDEEQAFILRLSGSPDRASLLEQVWCEVEGLGERVPVRLLEGTARSELLDAFDWLPHMVDEPDQLQVLQCKRRLTPDAEVALVYGAGVAAPGGLASGVEQRFAYTVRAPFTFETRCERPNAQGGCIPLLPIELALSAPAPREGLLQARLSGGGSSFRPEIPEDDEGGDFASRVVFKGPFPEDSTLELRLPEILQDDSGRPLANADSLPLSIHVGPAPVLLKFASGSFGVIERFAEGHKTPALLPLTVRATDPEAGGQALRLRQLSPRTDPEIIRWWRRARYYSRGHVNREVASGELHVPPPPPLGESDKYWVPPRLLSLLDGEDGVRATEIQPPDAARRPFEVIGLPLEPGFHVIEADSQRLGESLLDEAHGPARRMYVRTTALVTNLGLHFKLGEENALAWVTTLDSGTPVAGATVRVSTCDGRLLASGTTDADGLVLFDELDPDVPACDDNHGWEDDYFVSARHSQDGVEDMAFIWTSWDDGIERWRFNVPTRWGKEAPLRAHTVFDRTLLRAGETVSMKHFLRLETVQGLTLPEQRPHTLKITHLGSGQEFVQAMDWNATATGGLSAVSEFRIPQQAKLGVYEVQLALSDPDDSSESTLDAGEFRVEEFRLPVFEGSVAPATQGALVAVDTLPVQVQLGYINGGPAALLPVQVSATVQELQPRFAEHGDFRFAPPRTSDEIDDTAGLRVIANRIPVTLDTDGLGTVQIRDIPPSTQAQQLKLEASYADPNGELQTLSHTRTLWPAAVATGIRTERWASVGQSADVQVLALDTGGQPRAGVHLELRALQHTTHTTRKRMVGGFYTYDSHSETTDLGVLCSGLSDEHGLLRCESLLSASGELELVASAHDDQGRISQAATSVWVSGRDELWFGGRDDDRIDVLPERKRYEPGETARLQVRMPYREATALVTLEREGILDQRVLQLSGKDPTIEIPVEAHWSPNVYVSVLVLRGRVRALPWHSFLAWGYRAPRQWWHAYQESRRPQLAPTALVDLAKPSFRFGMAELRVGRAGHELKVSVEPEQQNYRIRDRARVRIRVTRPDGQPAAHADVALAAVDEALLELLPNRSWRLLDAMLHRRPWGVSTATAQMEIVGRRHYGRKALPAGGGGGHGATRELLDTLLLWQPQIQLDAQGETEVEVPLNDALTRFRIVAVADSGVDLFGTGEASIRSTQDLQIISGLPPLVRDGDRFQAMVTLRNGTDRAMRVQLRASAPGLSPEFLTAEIPANGARELQWSITVPVGAHESGAGELPWTLQATDLDSGAEDALQVVQRVVPAIPLSVQQAMLTQLDGSLTLDVAPPAGALPSDGQPHGGVRLALQPSLVTGLPAIRDWFANYPYTCLEQVTSQAIGMDDTERWRNIMDELPTYLDEDGLLYYFPPRAGIAHRGSDTLTAHLLSAAHEARGLDPAFELPPEAVAHMLDALTRFVEGRLERHFWSPRDDLGTRKLAAIAALARYGAARPGMLQSIALNPGDWPTSAVIDWLGILDRLGGIPNRTSRRQQAMQVLRSRLATRGTRMMFSTEDSDNWWWLMQGGDVNAARLLLAVMDDPQWQEELPRLVTGFLHRQDRGVWHTTTANLWGKLALQRFAQHLESEPVAGFTRASLGAHSERLDWSRIQPTAPAHRAHGAPSAPQAFSNNTALLPWAAHAEGQLSLQHEGNGKPWVTLQSLAALDLRAPVSAGYTLRRRVRALQQADPSLPQGHYTRGDILRVTLEVDASSDMTWVAITDPVPTGATILGSGLGRDSALATAGEERSSWGWLAYEERSFEAFRSYWEYLPRGNIKLEYTVRLNNSGEFRLPPSRVEAIYAPEMHGLLPNAPVMVHAP